MIAIVCDVRSASLSGARTDFFFSPVQRGANFRDHLVVIFGQPLRASHMFTESIRVGRRFRGISGGRLVKGPKLLLRYRCGIMTYHFTNSHDLPSALVPALAVAFEGIFGRFRATSMVEEGQTEGRASRLPSGRAYRTRMDTKSPTIAGPANQPPCPPPLPAGGCGAERRLPGDVRAADWPMF
jgi:hypothetical protein